MDHPQDHQEPLGLSCMQCQRRKVKCDRQLPCNECLRLRLQCVPSTRKPRAKTTARAKNAVELRQRVAKLEQLVQTMSGEQVAHDAETSSSASTVKPFQPELRRPSPVSTDDEASAKPSKANRPIPEVAKKYIGGSFWSTLTDEVNALADVLDNDDLLNDDKARDSTHRGELPQPGSAVLPLGSQGSQQYEPLLTPPTIPWFRPSTIGQIDRWDVPRLLDGYSRYAEPPHKLFHLPSLRKLILSAAPYLNKPADMPCNQFLKVSVCFAGLNALSDEQCWISYGMPKVQAVQEFANIVNAGLHHADPLVSTDLATLQALLLYAMTIRITDASRRSWSIVGLVAQTARAMYLHRATPDESPYMGQVRLRLWHCIVFMDHYSSRDRGTESTMRDWCPDPTMPIDCNDEDFDESSKEILPRTGQITDMTMALISFRGVVVSTAMEQPGQTWKQRLELAEQYRTKMERELGPLCQRALPQHQHIMGTVTIVCNSMVLRAVRPLHLDDKEPPPSVGNPYVLRIGVDLLQSALQLLPFVQQGWRRMPWIPWHAIVVVLAGLCTIRDTELANQAWPLVESAMAYCESDIADTKDGMLWRPIRKVHAKAVAYREAGNKRVGVHAKDAQASDQSIAGTEYQHGFSDSKSFTRLDAVSNLGSDTDFTGAQGNGIELPLSDDSWLNWEAIMTDLGADEPLFRDGF